LIIYWHDVKPDRPKNFSTKGDKQMTLFVMKKGKKPGT